MKVLILILIIFSFNYSQENIFKETKRAYYNDSTEVISFENTRRQYRISNDSLFIKESKKEYFYNKITKVFNNLYTCGQFRIIFYKSNLVVVHSIAQYISYTESVRGQTSH